MHRAYDDSQGVLATASVVIAKGTVPRWERTLTPQLNVGDC
eukprot:CAMPEP_0171901818 /NCGR_PEP_ID=MMETSP0993-20121228/768_1 /TAXON_ID=483369 /ORGANISM="non described non described, Strain CCMP2098" /LENGTH=40 /DNA_ID= /DNA_START= /DNA_END= /DNA_ORIENTATION=